MADSGNNPCRAICDSSKFHQPNSPLSYFFSITMSRAHQPKIRIKIPKTLGKTMQRISIGYQGSDAEKNYMRDAKKWVMSRKILAKKVGLMFCRVFGHKKTVETCSNDKNGKVCSTDNSSSGYSAIVKEEKIWESFRFNDIKSSRNYVNGEEKLSGNAAVERRKQKKQPQQTSRGYDKQGQVTFKDFFTKKKNGFSFFGSNCKSNKSANVNATTDLLIRKLERSPALPRVSVMTTSQKLNIVKEGEELCKKRILLGGKCRPLNNSGVLHYDKDGILLPEIVRNN